MTTIHEQPPAPAPPSAVPPAPDQSPIRLDLFDNSDFDRGRPRLIEAMWIVVKCVFFTTNFPWPNRLKRMFLRLFGAKIGRSVIIRPRTNVHFPWRLTIGDHCWIGEGCQFLSIAPITLDAHVALGHEVYLAAGGHDIRSATMRGQHGPIHIKSGTWVASRAFVGPGVTIERDVVVGAASVVMRNVEPAVVVVGSPARVLRPRVIDRP